MAGIGNKLNLLGRKVKMLGDQTKDAILVRFVKKATKKDAALWMVEYSMDDDLAREYPGEKRYQQPRYENQFGLVPDVLKDNSIAEMV